MWRWPPRRVALAAAAIAMLWLRPAAAAEPAAPSSSPLAITVSKGQLSVDVDGADLAQVLQDIAARAGFDLTINGPLPSVTAAFTEVPIGDGLQRLARDHEVMLIYEEAEGDREAGRLVEVHVFAAAAERPRADSERAALAEIFNLARQGTQAIPRLGGFLRDPNVVVRRAAARALGGLRDAASVEALRRALADPDESVRALVVRSLRRQGVKDP